jgi:hypothetical protein
LAWHGVHANDIGKVEDQNRAKRFDQGGVNAKLKHQYDGGHGFARTRPVEAVQEAWMLMAGILKKITFGTYNEVFNERR